MNAHTALMIGQLAAQSGVTAKTIRFYEQAGLIPPAGRMHNGYRVYSEADVERLRFIRAGRALGISLNDLCELVALRDHGERPCQQVIHLLHARLADVDAQIEGLRTLRAEMRALIEAAEQLPTQPRDDETCVCDLIGDERITPTPTSQRLATASRRRKR